MKTKYSRLGNPVGVKPKDVPVIVRELKRIEKNQGVITPGVVVKSAENKTSALHRFFTWDDTVAAAEYRNWQARALIGCVQVTITGKDGEDVSVRAFVNVSPREEAYGDDMIGGRGYISVEKSARNTSYHSQVLEYAKNQLVSWKRKFGSYREFAEVSAAIDRV